MKTDIKIMKRDGSLESFNYDKLVSSIGKAGISVPDSEKIAYEVKDWINAKPKLERGSQSIVKSSDIRDKITELLSKDFPIESDNYKSYKSN